MNSDKPRNFDDTKKKKKKKKKNVDQISFFKFKTLKEYAVNIKRTSMPELSTPLDPEPNILVISAYIVRECLGHL